MILEVVSLRNNFLNLFVFILRCVLENLYADIILYHFFSIVNIATESIYLALNI